MNHVPLSAGRRQPDFAGSLSKGPAGGSKRETLRGSLEESAGQVGGYLRGGFGLRGRVPPPPGRLARRRLAIAVAKWVLPAIAAVLLASIALWPEIQQVSNATRLSMAHVSGEVEGGSLVDARYNGVDEKGRPYTLTAATAWQIDPERVGLTMPKGDITLENGAWLMLTAKNGTFLQHLNQLDLVNDVTLYRDDGTTMHTHSATIDIKAGAAAGNDPVHVEGPFGTLDAKGFTVMDKGTSIDFPGPARVLLNGSN
ncbi:MAG TPA: LPS export ABC transporter periplasmic protein LptC [Rhodopila sp.]|uniref:LPS export ABC transporter periplasmic protein LptC n=1 Tax=Rhodopila sp. TaxID=2480087 RepID=UPI002D12881A|nr:LPS export ABC transporter periplasmic protein LptC [Rhodopila sp.]HVY15098.1 LPS export ABC transporter periplasmic protein LptC [Rhodopila sp.]